MKCSGCGAEIPAGAATCEYCGAAVEAAQVSGKDVFAEIKRSAPYANRQTPERLTALPQPGAAETAIPIVFFGLFITVAAVIFIGALVMAAAAASHFGGVAAIPCLMSVVPLGFIVLGVLMLVKTVKRSKEFAASPVLGRAAVVAGKRTATSGGGESSVRTEYHATFEFEDGSRQEFRLANEALYGQLAERDAGVLFSRYDLALAFDRVA